MHTDTLVIIPTYNEAENIVQIIEEVFSLPMVFDVLVVDDNSPDGTSDLVKQQQARDWPDGNQLHLIEREAKLGLGTAYLRGFEFALDRDYQYMVEMDADFSHNPKDLITLFKSCRDEGVDLAVGSRYITGVNVVNWPFNRVLLSLSASIYVRVITGMPIKDPTAGFVCFKRAVLEAIEFEKIKSIGYAFQIEMKYLSWRAGYNVAEVPIVFIDRIRGKSKMSISIFREAFLGVLGMRLFNYRKKLRTKQKISQIESI